MINKYDIYKKKIEKKNKEELNKLKKDSVKNDLMFHELAAIFRYFIAQLPEEFLKDVKEVMEKRNSN